MTTLQEWLDRKFIKEKLSVVLVDEILSPNFSDVSGGSLDLSGYSSMETVTIDRRYLKPGLFDGIHSIKLDSNLKLTGVSLMFNLWPVAVEINNCPNLQRIDFFTCFLNNLNFLNSISPENLTELSLTNNDFPSQDLSVFSRFVNLKILNVNNIPAQKWKKNLPYNRFYGSLAPLKNLTKLERLGIINTDIDGGLEYLSDSVKDIYCTSEEWKGAKVKKLEKELKKFGKPREDSHDYDYNFGHLLPLWKKANPEKVRIAQQSSSNRVDRAEETEQSFVAQIETNNDWKKLFKSPFRKRKTRSAITSLIGSSSNVATKIATGLDTSRKNVLNAQTWLDQKCLDEEAKNKICQMYLNEQIEGELDLADFTFEDGANILISTCIDENKLVIKNKGKNVKIIKLVNAQTWLDENYPKNGVCKRNEKESKRYFDPITGRSIEQFWIGGNLNKKRQEITELDISDLNLEGDLDLSGFVNLEKLNCSENKLTSLKISDCSKLEEINCSDNWLIECWQDISYDFSYQDKKGWESESFSKEQTKQWMETRIVGVDNYKFIGWLRGTKKIDWKWILNNREEFENLRKRYYEHGFCEQCGQLNTGKEWCQSCMSRHFQEKFKHWTSGNSEVDEFIRNQQLTATDASKRLSWIPYEEFTNIEYLAEGGFSKVYKAQALWWRKDDYGNDKIFALKSLNNSQEMTSDLLREVANHNLFSYPIIDCHGISQDPITKNYMIVMDYKSGGNMRQYLQSNYNNLSFKDKLSKLLHIAEGLKQIHEKELVHRDLHSGNILNGRPMVNSKSDSISYTTSGELLSGSTKDITSYITDLGLCKPAHEVNDDQLFGVVSYLSPELLSKEEKKPVPYTYKSDIYSFGVIAYELLNNAYPYYEKYIEGWTETKLSVEICRGLRPEIDKIPIPQLLKDLIKRCWDADPEKRPSAEELYMDIGIWEGSLTLNNTNNRKKVTSEEKKIRFDLQCEEEYDKWSKSIPYKIPSKAIATSQLINTKQIAQLFQESKKQALAQEIKKMEREIEHVLTEEQKELVSKFIQTRKKMKKDRTDKDAKKEAGKLEEQLEARGLSDETIEKIIKYCERFIKAEFQLETNIEIPTNQ